MYILKYGMRYGFAVCWQHASDIHPCVGNPLMIDVYRTLEFWFFDDACGCVLHISACASFPFAMLSSSKALILNFWSNQNIKSPSFFPHTLCFRFVLIDMKSILEPVTDLRGLICASGELRWCTTVHIIAYCSRKGTQQRTVLLRSGSGARSILLCVIFVCCGRAEVASGW